MTKDELIKNACYNYQQSAKGNQNADGARSHCGSRLTRKTKWHGRS